MTCSNAFRRTISLMNTNFMRLHLAALIACLRVMIESFTSMDDNDQWIKVLIMTLIFMIHLMSSMNDYDRPVIKGRGHTTFSGVMNGLLVILCYDLIETASFLFGMTMFLYLVATSASPKEFEGFAKNEERNTFP